MNILKIIKKSIPPVWLGKCNELSCRLPVNMGAIGATLGSATNNLHSSPKKVSTLYTTSLFYLNWIWRRKFEICQVLALGALPLGPHRSHMYHMNNYEYPENLFYIRAGDTVKLINMRSKDLYTLFVNHAKTEPQILQYRQFKLGLPPDSNGKCSSFQNEVLEA